MSHEPDADDNAFHKRFRGYMPIVIDVETGGFNKDTDALLEIAAVTLSMSDDGILSPDQTIECQVRPFLGANIEQSALDFTGINLTDPNRISIGEKDALEEVFSEVRRKIKFYNCKRAVLVGHNAHFDLGFVNAAAERCGIKRNPFHPFSCFDTATLSGLAFGHTVLAKTCEIAGIEFSNKEAHCASYDAQKTAELFCMIVNQWKFMGGWPL